MSQIVYDNIDPTLVGGTELADILNNFKNALMSGLKGPTRPTQIQNGGMWVDDSQEISSGILILKMSIGPSDVVLLTVNKTSGAVSISGSEDYFEVTRTVNDTSAPYLGLYKNRPGGVKNGDVIGDLIFRAKGSDTASHIIGRLRLIATEDITGSSNGAYYILEGTRTGAAAATEILRIINGRIGLGTTDPTHAVHVRSLTGAKIERVADDVTSPEVVFKKSRATGNQTLIGDGLGVAKWNGTDNVGGDFTGLSLEVLADDNHTAAVRGVKAVLRAIAKGASSLSTILEYAAGKLTMTSPLSVAGLERQTQSYTAVASEIALNADKSFIEVTGATPLFLKGISASSASKSFYLYNGTVNNITIINQSTDAVAANRIAVNGEVTMLLSPGKSVEFVRRDSTSRWVPLIEGNTGVTYHEALLITMKLIARSWREVYMQDIIDSKAPFLDVVSAINMPGVPGRYVGVGNSITGTLSASYCLNDYGTNGAGRKWSAVECPTNLGDGGVNYSDIAAIGTTTTEGYALAVRSGGTDRAFLLLMTTGLAPTVPASANINNAMAWRGVCADGTTAFIAVASSGASRIGRRTIASNVWTYVSGVDVPLYSVAQGGGLIVAVGGPVPGGVTNHAAWVSSAYPTFTTEELPDQATVTYTKVKYLNGTFVAISSKFGGNTLVTRNMSTGVWSVKYTAPNGTALKDISYGGGLYIATTDQNKAVVSADLETWELVDSVAISSLSYTGEYFAAVRSTVPKGRGFIESLGPSLV